MLLRSLWLGVLFGALVSARALAELAVSEQRSDRDPASSAEKPRRLDLDNGLGVVLAPDSRAATVAVCMHFDAGARRDPHDRPGLAALTAEMVADPAFGDEHDASRRAGRSDHAVDHDAAKFCTVLPHGELEFGLWRESIRLSRSGFDAERLERARAALARRAVGQLPLERAQERLRALALQADWSLAHPSVPSVPELSMHSLGDARRFHRRHYRSNNAVLSLSGRFESDVALALARRYLGDQGWRGQPAAPVDAPAQRQTSPRLIVLERPELATPVYSYAWRIPAAGSADHAASELIAALLASSENPEVGVALVRKRGAAERVTAEVVAQQGTGLLVVRVAATSRGDASDVEKALHAAVARLRHSGPSAEELAAARRRLELEGWSRVESMLGKAEALGRAALTGVDLGHAADPELRYRDSAAEAVKRVAAAHLAPALLSAVEQYPKGWRDPGQAALPKFHIVSAGETLIGIAKRHGVELDALLELNGLNARRPIVPGQKLRIPAGGKPPPAPKVHVVKKGETLSGIAHRHRVSVRSLARQNGIDPKKPIRIGQSLVIPR